MSDAIREAFEALDELVEMAVQHHGQVKAADSYRDTVKAALQSQTAPAVPEGLDIELIVNALSDYEQALTNGDLDGAGHHLPSDIELQGHLLSLLAAAPQPDHSPDAGKVVHWAIKNPGNADQRRCESRAVRKALGFAPDADDVSPRDLVDAIAEIKAAPAADGGEVEPVAWAVFADNGNIRIWGRDKPEAFTDAVPLYLSSTVKDSLTVQSEPVGYADPDTLDDYLKGDRLHMPVYRPDASAEWQSGIPLYTRPAQPRNEVQAEALEGFIDEITKQIGYLENKSEQARTLRKVNSWLIKCAARLRRPSIDPQDAAARLRSNGGDD